MREQKTESKTKRELTGVVVSNKMYKTVVVKVDRRVKHRQYKKIITKSTKFHVHDPEQKCKMWDNVIIRECRPISKTKSWKLVNILEKIG